MNPTQIGSHWPGSQFLVTVAIAPQPGPQDFRCGGTYRSSADEPSPCASPMLCRLPMTSAGHVEAVEPRCSAIEQVGFLGVACALGKKLAGVPGHLIGGGALVDGKVALEHAS